MKREEKVNLTRKVTVRFTEQEYKILLSRFENSTKRKLSGFIRSILMERPVTMYTRNRSFDDFVAEMILLRNELKSIGNNLNQTVKKLHSLDKDPEIKSWAIQNEKTREIFFQKVEEINLRIWQIESKWSQE